MSITLAGGVRGTFTWLIEGVEEKLELGSHNNDVQHLCCLLHPLCISSQQVNYGCEAQGVGAVGLQYNKGV